MNNFIVELTYIVPIDQIEAHLDDHMDFLADGATKGYFISWGPKVPRSGGIIIAKAKSYDEIEAFCANDPFVIHGVSEMSITEFTARKPITVG